MNEHETDNITEGHKFEFLTPKDNIDNIEIYSKALEESLDNYKVKNIAITGSYGSGKSSILKTYFKSKDISPLFISLAKFHNKNHRNNDKTEEELIEKGILKQLTYRLENKETPKSKFKAIEKPKDTKYIIYAIVIFLFIISLITSIKSIKYFIDYVTMTNGNNLYTWGFIPIVSIIILIYTTYITIKHVLDNNILKKIKIHNTELELDKENDSIFDKYLDEIIYFFEVSKFKIVVFEDLDRFNDINIFIKLREINSILNNNDRIKKNNKITFIYAIRDDLFNEYTDRTKFFDFIIPIVPILDNSNSKNWLIKKLKNYNIKIVELIDKSKSNETQMSKKFINGISLFINEMRVLINIFNEFIIYKEKLENKNLKFTSIEIEQLFALIAYKNLELKDFIELQNDKGLLYNKIYENNQNSKTEFIKPFKNHSKTSSTLIDFLIKNKYINKQYHHLISIFVEGNLNKKDYNFIRSVSSGNRLDENYELTNIKEVINELDKEYFSDTQILNYYLLNELIEIEKEKNNE